MGRKADIPVDGCFDCGRITEEAGRSGRHVIVRFRCAHCPGSGRARLSEVRSGVTRSCGCKKKLHSSHTIGAVQSGLAPRVRARSSRRLSLMDAIARPWSSTLFLITRPSSGSAAAVNSQLRARACVRLPTSLANLHHWRELANEWDYRRQKSYEFAACVTVRRLHARTRLLS